MALTWIKNGPNGLPMFVDNESSGSTTTSSGSSGGMYGLTATIGLDKAAFDEGINDITYKLSLMQLSLSGMLEDLHTLTANVQTIVNQFSTLLSSTSTTMTGVSTAASTANETVSALSEDTNDAAEAVSDIVDKLTDENFSDELDAFDTLATKATATSTTATQAAASVTESATGATEAAGEMAKSVSEIGESAETSSFSFEKLASAAASAWSTIKNVASVVWDIGGELVDAAKTYEKSIRTYTVAFAGVEDEASAAMQRISEQTGLYSGVIRGNIAQIQTQFRSAGMSQEEALLHSEQAMLLAADAAAHYGITMDEATRRVMSFLRGNVEGGESIGLFTTMAAREQGAQAMYGVAWKDLQESQRQQVLLQIAQEAYASGGQTGAAARYADSYLTAEQNLAQRWADIQGKMGTPILQMIGEVLSEFFDILDTPEMQEVVDKFIVVLEELLTSITSLLVEFMKWAGTEGGQAAIKSVLDMLTGILAFFGFTPSQSEIEYANELSHLAGTTIAPDDVSSYSNVLDTIVELINALDLFYDLDYGDASSAEVAAARAAYEAAMSDFLASSTADQQAAMEEWIESSGIREEDSPWRYNADGYWPGGTRESLPDFVFNLLKDITSEVQKIPGSVVQAMAGITVQMDGTVVGHLVADTVASDIARSVSNGMFTAKG